VIGESLQKFDEQCMMDNWASMHTEISQVELGSLSKSPGRWPEFTDMKEQEVVFMK
jgi:hypothetical protein